MSESIFEKIFIGVIEIAITFKAGINLMNNF